MPIGDPEYYQPYPFSREIGRVIYEDSGDYGYAAHEVSVNGSENALDFLIGRMKDEIPYLSEYSNEKIGGAIEWQIRHGSDYPNLS